VIGGRRRYARAVFVTAVTAFAIAAAPSTTAQGVRNVPWWHELQGPDGPTQTFLLQTVQAMPASAFDPKLPAISLDTWLWNTLAPFIEVPRPQLVEWRVSFCLDPFSEIPGPGPELCAEGTAQLSAEKTVQIVILVADAVRSPVTGRPDWRPTPPSLRDVYVERLNGTRRIDSLDVPALGALRELLSAPFEQWPTVEFESTIDWDPPNPAPGDTVRFSISVRNTGKRSAHRAWIKTLISPCCANAEARHEWFPRVAAGQSVRVEVAVPLPEGRALAVVSVRPWQGYKMMRESDPNKEATVAPVGYPARPR
jgi:hypothetical protein